jgi:radical SAM superfamily enzyme YgiQ (UPF0313 family)
MKKKIKLLLYNISYRVDFPNQAFVPLAFVLLEEYLLKFAPDVEVFRYDYVIDDPSSSAFTDYSSYDLVGFQLTYPNAPTVMKLLEEWETEGKRPFTVIGGVLASAIAIELVQKYNVIDAVVVAEGEDALLQLTRYVSGEIRLNDIPGIAYRNDKGEAVYNQGKRPIDFDQTPVPRRDFLREMPPDEVKRTSIRIQSARGCLGGCTFCQNSYKNRLDKVTTKQWRGMSPERLIEEIEHLYHNYGVRIINFVDPSFEDPGKKGKERIRKIANLLIEKDLRISFKVNMRAETFNDDDMDLLWLLKKAGMDIIILGIEACSDDELKIFGKNADISTITRAYWRLNNMDCFNMFIGYMPVYPYATVESLSRSYDYLHGLGLSYAFNIFRCALIPLRGTAIYDRTLKDGLITNHDDILALPEYKFVDPDAARINSGIQTIKVDYPVLADLHKRIMDALNIKARTSNRIFEGMLDLPEVNDAFEKFKNHLSLIRSELNERYYSLQKEMIQKIKTSWNPTAIEKTARELVILPAEVMLSQVEKEIDSYCEIVHNAGYDISVFESKAWGAYCQEKVRISG